MNNTSMKKKTESKLIAIFMVHVLVIFELVSDCFRDESYDPIMIISLTVSQVNVLVGAKMGWPDNKHLTIPTCNSACLVCALSKAETHTG